MIKLIVNYDMYRFHSKDKIFDDEKYLNNHGLGK